MLCYRVVALRSGQRQWRIVRRTDRRDMTKEPLHELYLKRYLGGEYEQVWAELTMLGPGVRKEPVYSDALAVARETMRRAAKNVEMLVPRLMELNYRFAYPDEIWIRPDDESLEQLRIFDQTYGPLPLSLRVWHETVGLVDFTGSHPSLSFYEGIDRDDVGYLECYSDPLCVYRPIDDTIHVDEGHTRLDIAPDSMHKANFSGGGPMRITLPDPAADAPLVSDDWNGMYFVSYLRECFRWGGFPGLRNDRSTPWHDPAESFGVVAWLKDGLLPL